MEASDLTSSLVARFQGRTTWRARGRAHLSRRSGRRGVPRVPCQQSAECSTSVSDDCSTATAIFGCFAHAALHRNRSVLLSRTIFCVCSFPCLGPSWAFASTSVIAIKPSKPSKGGNEVSTVSAHLAIYSYCSIIDASVKVQPQPRFPRTKLWHSPSL